MKILQTKLLDIMADFGSVEKKGRNDFNKYDYIREADVALKFQELLVKHKVFCFSSVIEAVEKQVTSAGGKPSMYATVTVEYTFVNAESPTETHSVRAAGSGMDTGDKALYKALTGAHKYFMIRNFNLGSDEDAEKVSPEMGKTDSRPNGQAAVDTSDFF